MYSIEVFIVLRQVVGWPPLTLVYGYLASTDAFQLVHYQVDIRGGQTIWASDIWSY